MEKWEIPESLGWLVGGGEVWLLKVYSEYKHFFAKEHHFQVCTYIWLELSKFQKGLNSNKPFC